MEIEIKLKCSICEAWLNGGQRLETPDTLIFVQPCPHCHPAKPEKVTPKDGETVEVCDNEIWDGCFNTRVAKGTRNRRGKILVVFTAGGTAGPYEQWRYPGETEWKD